MTSNQNSFNQSAGKEFKEIVSNYILPLIDTHGELTLEQGEFNASELISFQENNDRPNVITFAPCKQKSLYYCTVQTYSTTAIKKRLTAILNELLKVAEYNCTNGVVTQQRQYGRSEARKAVYKKRTLDIAFEFGICSSLLNSYENATTLHSILCKMTEWAGRTYEGERVPFGIVIDFNHEVNANAISYLEFLNNDSSAVFSDGIFSGILLDKTGKLDSFITKKTNLRYEETNKTIFVPYQYTDIAKHCTKKSIGIIVLTSGEILLIENQSIYFAKRNNKWVSFDWARVYVKLRPYFIQKEQNDKEYEDLIRERIKIIYCTLLDVSFSHTGGCLAIIHTSTPQQKVNKVIKERFNLFIKSGELKKNSKISYESKEKIKVLKHLLSDSSNKETSFFDIDGPLRKEIISLDGATVVKLDGSFYCAGSIVALSGGSEGGGRTAASQKLAELGVGIKVSEDGYIKAFGKPMDGQKENFISLFEI